MENKSFAPHCITNHELSLSDRSSLLRNKGIKSLLRGSAQLSCGLIVIGTTINSSNYDIAITAIIGSAVVYSIYRGIHNSIKGLDSISEARMLDKELKYIGLEYKLQ